MRHGVRIRNFEAPLLQVIAEIQLGSADEECALRIDNNTHPIRFHHDIAVRRSVDQIHLVLQTGTTATNHRNAQGSPRPTLPLEQRAQFRAGSVQNTDQLFVANPVVDRDGGGFHAPRIPPGEKAASTGGAPEDNFSHF